MSTILTKPELQIYSQADYELLAQLFKWSSPAFRGNRTLDQILHDYPEEPLRPDRVTDDTMRSIVNAGTTWFNERTGPLPEAEMILRSPALRTAYLKMVREFTNDPA